MIDSTKKQIIPFLHCSDDYASVNTIPGLNISTWSSHDKFLDENDVIPWIETSQFNVPIKTSALRTEKKINFYGLCCGSPKISKFFNPTDILHPDFKIKCLYARLETSQKSVVIKLNVEDVGICVFKFLPTVFNQHRTLTMFEQDVSVSTSVVCLETIDDNVELLKLFSAQETQLKLSVKGYVGMDDLEGIVNKGNLSIMTNDSVNLKCEVIGYTFKGFLVNSQSS